METTKESFIESYGDSQFVDGVRMEIAADGTGYKLRFDTDHQGDLSHLLLDKVELPQSTTGFSGDSAELSADNIREVAAVLGFAAEWADEQGYEYRGPQPPAE